MATPLIICDNCGAKWRLPENFTGAQSKCRQCGSAIDVARQRNAGEGAPDAARPAAGARPAIDRSKEAPRPAERPPTAASERARTVDRTGDRTGERSAERSGERGGERTAGSRRRGERGRDAKPARGKLVYVLVALAVVAIVVAVILLM
jgi:hypothetical protein